jgi:hypothetical protein
VSSRGAAVRVLIQGTAEDALDAAINGPSFRRLIRVWYDGDVNSAIVKLLSGAYHDVMAVQFLLEIFAGVLQISGHNPHSVVGVGSTRFRCPGKRSKEGDAGIKCASRTGGASWPNVMIEVGSLNP